MATRAARRAGVPVDLFVALITQGERSWKGWQTSPAGARGPSQLMPGTAAGLERKYGINTKDFFGNLLGGAYYLREQLNTFKNPRLAVAAYNAGPGAVSKYGDVPPYQETQRYVQNVFAGLHNVVSPKNPGSPSSSGALAARGADAASAPLAPQSTLEALDTFKIQRPPSVDLTSQLTENLGMIGQGWSPTETLAQTTPGLLEQWMQPSTLVKVKAPRLSQQPQVPQRGEAAVFPTGNVRTPHVTVEGKLTPVAQKAVSLVREYLGTPYVWGGSQPGGFDCSGLIQYTWAKLGVKIPRVTYDQWRSGRPVAQKDLQPGDAVFFHSGPRGPEHEGMYVGGGKFIEAPHTGANVRVSKLSDRSDYMGARRFA